MKQTLQERIEEISLLFFSRQGFNETSTAEIASEADVSEASIFRLFKTKKDLYSHILTKYSAEAETNANLNVNSIFSKITFEDINKDFTVIVDSFFTFYFQHIHITRIYISNAIQFNKLIDFNSLIFPQLKGFMEDYLQEMSARGFLDRNNVDSLADIVISSIFQEVALLTIFEKKETLDDYTRANLKSKWAIKINQLREIYNWTMN